MPRRKAADPAPPAPVTEQPVQSAMARTLELYVQLRDQKAAIRAEADNQIAAIDNKLEAIEMKLNDVMKAQGVDSIKAGGRTAYVTVTMKPRVDDWPGFEAFVLEQGDLSWLHRRPSEGVFKAYVEEHKACPPGTTAVTAREVRVRNS